MTIQAETDVPTCSICHKPKDNHPYRHEFSPIGNRTGGLIKASDRASSEPSVASQGRVGIAPGGDPVLRLVLLRKGLIEVADLDAVEAELRATGVAGYEPPRPLG